MNYRPLFSNEITAQPGKVHGLKFGLLAIALFTTFAFDRASAFDDSLPRSGEILEGTVSGVVRDTNGSPFMGALVSFHPGHFPRALPYTETKSDELGRFTLKLRKEISGLHGWDSWMNPTNFIMARGFEKNVAAIRVFSSFPTNLDLILEPGLSLSGTVVDTNGLPIPNAAAELMISVGGPNSKFGTKPITTDSLGKFFIPALPQGHYYFFTKGFTVDGYGMSGGVLLEKDSFTNHHAFPSFVLKKANRILMGKLLDPENKPVEKATVITSGRGQREIPATYSDANGLFRIESLCEGEVRIFVNWINPIPGGIHLVLEKGNYVTAQAGDTNVLIRMRDPNLLSWAGRQMTLTGSVLDPAGRPVPSVNLRIWNSANPFLNTSGGKDGKYTFRWQLSPPLTGTVIGQRKPILIGFDPNRNLAGIQELEATTTNMDLYLQPGLLLTGRIEDTKGSPLSNVSVSLHMTLNKSGGELTQSWTESNGMFKFTGLPREADYDLAASLNGYSHAIRILPVVDPTEPNTLKAPVTQLSRANLTVEGKVMDADGKPVPEIWVNLYGPNQLGGNARTDTNGHFVFKNVASGVVMGETGIPAANGVPAKRGSFKVKAGETNVMVQLK
ncbi:MAG: hypothetical protein JWN25_1380 [Verrucomicrobiales bacterium]|nr:hypothetical protein [Verrucomicrobiales bacterium]